MTPYSLAFTIFRVVAVLCVLQGLYYASLVEFYNTLSGSPYSIWESLIMVLRGIVLYPLANWLAKAAIWKIMPPISN